MLFFFNQSGAKLVSWVTCVFPRLTPTACFCFEFRLAHCTLCFCCNSSDLIAWVRGARKLSDKTVETVLIDLQTFLTVIITISTVSHSAPLPPPPPHPLSTLFYHRKGSLMHRQTVNTTLSEGKGDDAGCISVSAVVEKYTRVSGLSQLVLPGPEL